MHWTVVRCWNALASGVGNKSTVSQTFDTLRCPRPEIAFSILKQRSHWTRVTIAFQKSCGALRIDPYESFARTNPDVGVAIFDHGQCLNLTQRRSQSRSCNFDTIPASHSIVGTDPQLFISNWQEAIDFSVRQRLSDTRNISMRCVEESQ